MHIETVGSREFNSPKAKYYSLFPIPYFPKLVVAAGAASVGGKGRVFDEETASHGVVEEVNGTSVEELGEFFRCNNIDAVLRINSVDGLVVFFVESQAVVHTAAAAASDNDSQIRLVGVEFLVFHNV